MGIKEKIIKKLENDVEPDAGHIELENLTEEERSKLFIKFGEGNMDLTNFLRTTYNHNAPSVFCCSGHGVQSAYVVLKVSDENIDLLKKVGKVLSKQGISTNFENNHINYQSVYDMHKEKDNVTVVIKSISNQDVEEYSKKYEKSEKLLSAKDIIDKHHKEYIVNSINRE